MDFDIAMPICGSIIIMIVTYLAWPKSKPSGKKYRKPTLQELEAEELRKEREELRDILLYEIVDDLWRD